MKRFLPGFAALLSSGLLLAQPAQAGLVLHIDAPIREKEISAIRAEGSQIQVVLKAGVRSISLPAGTRDDAVRWAEQYQGGPLIISIDSAFVDGVGANYVPPVIPRGLHSLLLRYDSYFSSVVCGARPVNGAPPHPLTRQANGNRLFPVAQYQDLMSTTRRDPTALWYRRLAARYINPPGCFGEVTLQVVPHADGRVSAVAIQPWLYATTRQWYRGIDSPSTWDHWAGLLPYQPLLSDLRSNFDLYRSAFGPINELSSLLEAVAILYAVRTRSPAVWTAFRADLKPEQISRPEPFRSNQAKWSIQYPEGLDPAPWRQLSAAWVGPQVDTPAEANLALSLLMEEKMSSEQVERWVSGIQQAAGRDAALLGKLSFASLLFGEQLTDAQLSSELEQLFTLLRRESPTSLRLRAQALRRISQRLQFELPARPPVPPKATPPAGGTKDDDDAESEHEDRNWELTESVLANERERVVSDFVAYALPRCLEVRDGRDMPLVWESLLDDIYSVGLLALSPSHPQQQDLVRAAACAHFRRGASIQVGRELAYQHAQFRFLGHLRPYAQTPKLKEQIAEYRRALAELMGLRAWTEARYDK